MHDPRDIHACGFGVSGRRTVRNPDGWVNAPGKPVPSCDGGSGVTCGFVGGAAPTSRTAHAGGWVCSVRGVCGELGSSRAVGWYRAVDGVLRPRDAPRAAPPAISGRPTRAGPNPATPGCGRRAPTGLGPVSGRLSYLTNRAVTVSNPMLDCDITAVACRSTCGEACGGCCLATLLCAGQGPGLPWATSCSFCPEGVITGGSAISIEGMAGAWPLVAASDYSQ